MKNVKKYFKALAAVMLLACFNTTNAQVSAYTFAQGAGTFTALTATYTQHTSGTTDYATYTNIPLGFTFCFNGVNYTAISISNDGYIVMGSTIWGTTVPISSGSEFNVISAYAADLQGLGTGSLRSKMTGTAPNRQFTVEWQHYEHYFGADDYSFQIILTETTNLIEIIYTGTTTVASNTSQVGLKGATTADFSNRTKVNATSWNASSAGVANTDVMSTGGNLARSPLGKFTWTPPAACSGTPANGTTTTSAASVCSGNTVNLAVTGSTNSGCGLTFQWQSSPDNSTWTNIAGATASTYTPTITSALYFKRITSCNGTPNTGSASVQVILNAPASCYCTPAPTSVDGTGITNVTCGTINNTTGAEAGNYGNYSAQITNVNEGSTVTVNITYSTGYTYVTIIWVDLNNDGDFGDAGEQVYSGTSLAANPTTLVATFTMPMGTSPGNHRMRIGGADTGPPTSCYTGSYATYEDYTLNVVAVPVCSGSPANGTASASVASATCSTNSDITGAGYTTGVSGLTYQWQSSLNNSTWANIAGATTPALYSATTVTVTTYYHLVTTCSNGGGTGTSTSATVTINPVVAGTTVSSVNPACSGTTFTLSLSGNSTAGVTYQWQSSSDGSSWSNIAGATSATYNANQTTATYYRCNITCTSSGTTVASSSLQVTMNTPTNCYCINTGGSASYYISTFSTTLGTTNISNNTGALSASGYGNFTAQSASAMQGVTLNFSITTGSSAFSTYGFGIWIDWNQDGDFNDAGENVYITSSYSNTTTGSFTVPVTALTGSTRMRVVADYNDSSPSACPGASNTECEDYTFTVIPLPVCSGVPTPGTAASSIANFCNSGTPTLSTTGYTTGVSGIGFQWYQSATTGPYAWSQIPGAIAATYASPSISQTTYYYCEVTCSASSAATNTVTVSNSAATITSTNNPVSVVCGGAASLTATASGGATVNWYTAATGGTAVATGSPYAPTVSANTTYYCTANAAGSTGSVGKPSYNGTDGTNTASNYGLRFDAIVPFTLVSVKVYAASAGTNVRIQLQDNTGANIGAVIAVNNIPAGVNTIPCNLSIPVGTGYRLVKANNNNALGRSSSGLAFPYASTPAGICNITSSEWGGSTTSYYYYYYDWVISTGCESSPRTPVNVTVTGVTAPVCSAYSSPTNGATGVCPVGTVIDWLASTTACRAATSYKLYFGTDAAATNIINGVDVGNVLTYNLGNLTANTTYYWKIVPTNAGGDAVGCAIQSFTTAANPGSICPGLLGSGVIPVASLPYASGAGTTAGSGDDLTSVNTTTCGSAYYLTGEDQVFYFTPTSTGTVAINLTSTGTYTGLMLYDGCPLNTATCGAAVGSCVASSTGYTGNKTLNACVTAGVTYYLILDSYAAPTTNPYSNLTISAVTPLTVATNDLPCNANPLVLSVTENGNNSCTGSTSEPNAPSCWTSGTRNTVWYTVVAPASGQISVRTMLGTLLNTQIAMYQGACGSLTQVSPTTSSCNDNLTGCGSSEASQMNVTGLTPGTTYYVVVDGGNDLTGSFQIVAIDPTTQSFPSTPGQDCSIAFPTCNSILTVSDPGYANTGSTCDFDGSDDCTSGERSSVWYNIVIGTNGFLTFDLYPNDYGGPGSGAGGETDYDFLVWKTGGAGATTCAGMQTNSATGLVACNFSYLGVTGVSDAAGNTPAFFSPDNFDAAYEPRIPVIAGEQYTIVIQNYTGSTSGFTIDYTGSGSAINYAPSATILNWSGTSSTAWALPANWGGCAIPACGVSAVVGALVPNFPTISANQSVNNLTIDAGATLTINAGVTLTVCGNFVNNGTLVMAPTATLLFNNTAAHTISGNLTGTNAIGNITVTQTAGSVSFMSDIDIAGTLTTSNSTSIINSNNRYVKLAGNFVNATGNTTYTNTGTTGTLEFNGTAAQTYNQGSSQLDLNNVVMNHTSTGVTLSTNMFIKATTGTLTLTAGKINTGANVVNVVNTTPACVTTGNATSYVNGNLRRYLAAGATGSFDFPVGNTANYERANLNFTTAAAAGAIQLLARFDAWGGGWPMPGAPGWGPECAVTYNQPFLDNGYWSIDASAASTGLYNMTAYNTGYTNAAAGWSIAKSASGAPAWTTQGTCQAGPVTAVVRNAMSGFSKFATIQSSSVLPLQLLSFKGVNKTTYNELSWETASEEKISGFELESSANGFDFKMIHSRSANGTTNQSAFYKFSDYNFFSPISYYRLKIINDDNAITYSSVIAIENKQKSQMVTKVFPNPAINEVNVSMEIPFDTEMRMEIKDLLGRVVYSKTMNVSAGNQEFNINTQELSQGTYVISTYIDNLPETNNKLVISK